MEPDQQRRRSKPTWIEAALAGLVVLGFGAGLVRISLLNNGLLIAPALAGILSCATFGVRALAPAGRARSMLTLVGGGLLLVGLLFVAALIVLLIALSNRGA